MSQFITPFEDIITEVESYQDLLDNPVDDDNSTILFDYGNKLSAIISRTGTLKGDARYYRDEARKSEIIKDLEKLTKEFGMSATAQRLLIESSTANHNALYEKVERLNNTAGKQLEWCRTKLSFLKEEMNASRGMNNQNNRRQ